jgi:hypothetical protein
MREWSEDSSSQHDAAAKEGFTEGSITQDDELLSRAQQSAALQLPAVVCRRQAVNTRSKQWQW